MSVTDELLQNNAAYAQSFDKGKESVRGFIYEVETGLLREVS
jgi:hypothetical protein